VVSSSFPRRGDGIMSIANLHIPAVWRDEKVLIRHLASELVRGRLSLMLGAGISDFYGLPLWLDLVNRLRDRCGEARITTADDPIRTMGALRIKHYKNKTPEFLKAVAEELYRGTSVDLEKIRLNSTLAAIGSIVMASRRGNASKVVTFNYDNLLETYLEYHGFVTSSVFRPRHWAGNADVTVYHPHGYLPRNQQKAWSDDIVVGTEDYMKLMQPDVSNLWRPLLLTLMRTHSMIYIGVSGKDIHLESLLVPLKEQHATVDERIAFHSVRFALKSRPDPTVETQMSDWGVHTHLTDSYPQIAPLLFKVCQEARRLRQKADKS
jgi:SIR2-like protein